MVNLASSPGTRNGKSIICYKMYGKSSLIPWGRGMVNLLPVVSLVVNSVAQTWTKPSYSFTLNIILDDNFIEEDSTVALKGHSFP